MLQRLNGLRVLSLIAGSARHEGSSWPDGPPPGPRASGPTPPAIPGRPEDDVDAMIACGVCIDEIEQYLDSLWLEDDERSALWLLAWSRSADPTVR